MNGIYEKAIEFAIKAHEGQRRKSENCPYIVHPLEASTIVATMTSDEDVLAAAVLHDTVEDTSVTLAMLEKEFGSKVAKLVASETEDKLENVAPAASWHIRKSESISKLKNCDDINIKIMWIGDKLSNIRSLYRVYLREGKDFLKYFHIQDRDLQRWYYYSILDATEELSDFAAWKELSRLVDLMFS